MVQIYSTNISREQISNMVSDLPETQIPLFQKGVHSPLIQVYMSNSSYCARLPGV